MTILADILERVKQEAIRLNHYYLGVEHLFLALLTTENSLTGRILQHAKQSPELVYTMLIDSMGHSLDRRYWEGFRPTPRYTKVLSIAENYSHLLSERELLLAILDEGDSIPVRLLTSLGLEIELLSETAANWNDDSLDEQEMLQIEGKIPVAAIERKLLRQFFTGSIQVIEEFFTQPTASHILNVRDDMNRCYLVRFDHPRNIFYEKQRIETYHDASLFDFAINQVIGAVRYPTSPSTYSDLVTYGNFHGWQAISQVLQQQVYPNLKALQNEAPQRYRFGLWREYEALLPPALVMEAHYFTSGTAIRPLETWSRDRSIRVGAALILEDFTVREILSHRGRIILGAGAGSESVHASSKIEINALDEQDMLAFAVGQSEREIRGIAVGTREDTLRQQVSRLKPEFPTSAPQLLTPLGVLPNPLFSLPDILDAEIDNYWGIIHGNLNTSSILLDGRGMVQLVNYQDSRFGHLLFDWATLELSLWADAVLQGESWEAVWKTAGFFHAINTNQTPDENEDLPASLHPILTIRGIVADWLTDWGHYYAVLMLLSLANLQQENLPMTTRQLYFVLCAAASEAFYQTRPNTEPIE